MDEELTKKIKEKIDNKIESNIEKRVERWNDIGIKSQLMYSCAVLCIVCGLSLCVVSFFVTHAITSGVLGFLGICLTFAGSVFGISAHYKTKESEFESKVYSEISKLIGQ